MFNRGVHFPHQQFRRMRLMLSLGLFILFLASHTGTAHAARTLYVSPGGSDTSNSCLNASAPCKTANYAIGQMVDGDTLKVGAGTYTDFMSFACPVLGTKDYRLVISNKNCSTVGCIIETQSAIGSATLSGGYANMCITGSQGWTIRGLNFSGGSGPHSVIHDSSNTVLEYDVYTFSDLDSNTENIQISNSPGTRITRSTFNNSMGCKVHKDSGGGVSVIDTGGAGTIIEQSLFSYGSRIGKIANSSAVIYRRNTVKHFSAHGMEIEQGSSNILMENNIFKGDPACANSFNTCAGGTNIGQACTSDTNCSGSYCIIPAGPRIVDVYEVDGLVVRNNTVVGHGYDWQHWVYMVYDQQAQATAGCTGAICDRKNIRIYNNLVYDIRPLATNWVNISDSSFTTQSGLALDGNLYFQGAETWTNWLGCGGNLTWAQWKGCNGWGGTNNTDPNSLNIAPTFTNYAGQDYHPKDSSSPQVNAGVSGTDTWGANRCATEDFSGNLRTDGQCDIGAFEFGSGGGADTTPPAAPTGLKAQ